ncbi:maestro heat-like repeat family member 5 [Heliangelus exortis]|uniref:maestro heat-like repeat family member 5 n=1 Tax=Heliangelus exortis TaxID=472823 RepID=UPI003A924708
MNYAMTFYSELLGCQGLGKDWSDLRILHAYLRHGSQTIRLRALEGLVALSGDPQMAREMRGRSLLDRILRCLKDPSTDIRMEALLFFQTMMGQLKRKEASPIALLLAQKLPPLFGDESSQVQELSLSLFGDTMKAVVSRDKAEMKEAIRGVVVSLFLHMNAESRSVAEASGKTLLICAKFLGWRKLKRVIKKGKNWMIGETLLKQDRSRVEDHVCFSLHYLWDSQAGVRMEAIRFIGEPQPLGTLFWQPGPSPRHCPGTRSSPVAVLAINSLEYDPDPSVRSLAAQTLHILQSVREPKRSRWSFPGLCFC